MSTASVRKVFIAAFALVTLVHASSSWAHEGPPFPILEDQRVGNDSVSIWTDPDVGQGTVYVIIEPSDRTKNVEIAAALLGVAPVSARLPERTYELHSEPVRVGARYIARVELDRQEMWRFRVHVTGTTQTQDLIASVEATPAGTIGPIGLLLYAFPFVAVGLLWLKAVMRSSTRPRLSPS